MCPPPQFLVASLQQVPFSAVGVSRPMVRRRHPDETKVLFVNAAQNHRGFQCAGTSGGLSPTTMGRIMRTCGKSPPDAAGEWRSANDLRTAPALVRCYAESLLAGICGKSSGFLLPYWMEPVCASLPGARGGNLPPPCSS